MPVVKVLLADDEEATLGIMARKVEDAGYAVVAVNNGQEAWEKIQSDEPDVIVLDITMPGLDGWQVLKKVRENPAPKKWQPVIILSALAQSSDVKHGFKLEADHYLTKPCSIEDVVKAIRLMVSLTPMRFPS